MIIKILGAGCAKCKKAERVVRETVAESGADAQVGKVTDLREIVTHGVFSTPAVIVDGEIKVSGAVPSKKDVLGWLQ
ncbi:thioredoxin family protein [Desulfoplanes sp.]